MFNMFKILLLISYHLFRYSDCKNFERQNSRTRYQLCFPSLWESQFKTSTIFEATVFNAAILFFHVVVYSTHHRKTLTHILPVRQVRSNCVISFMAVTTALTGTDFQARKLRFLSWQRFLQVLYFKGFLPQVQFWPWEITPLILLERLAASKHNWLKLCFPKINCSCDVGITLEPFNNSAS